MKTAFTFAEEGLLHDTGPRHPERPDRLRAIRDAFEAAGLKPPRLEAKRASRDDLLRIHTAEHIDTIEESCRSAGHYPDADTVMMEASWDAALLAAGSAIGACEAVLDGAFDSAFNAMRPPGHHAERDHAMGFCLFNNVAIAAKWLTDARGLSRVAILDWDVHHGNGTQHSLYDDPSVYYISLHQFPHYPGTGRAEERGEANTNLNIPMAPGVSAELWLEAIETVVVPTLETFDPEILLISCGFDAHKNDPLSDQNLTTDDFAEMTRRIKGIAGGRIVSLLEGGYDTQALGESSVAHFRALQE